MRGRRARAVLLLLFFFNFFLRSRAARKPTAAAALFPRTRWWRWLGVLLRAPNEPVRRLACAPIKSPAAVPCALFQVARSSFAVRAESFNGFYAYIYTFI